MNIFAIILRLLRFFADKSIIRLLIRLLFFDTMCVEFAYYHYYIALLFHFHDVLYLFYFTFVCG